jgi:hypothetical protein
MFRHPFWTASTVRHHTLLATTNILTRRIHHHGDKRQRQRQRQLHHPLVNAEWTSQGVCETSHEISEGTVDVVRPKPIDL